MSLVKSPVMSVSPQDVAFARELEREVLQQPQVDIATLHTFHAGVYARTIMIPKSVVLTGAEIKIDTVLIVSGDCLIFGGTNGAERFEGYHVLPGARGRKSVFYALQDTWLTMLFASNATTAEEAENEFTDEADKLASRRVK